MSKFTPGPWAILYETMVMSGNRSVASCGGYSANVDTEKVRAENIANARLIAAAPLMYEALESVLKWRALDGDGISNPVLAEVQAALAAAGATDE